MKKEFLTIFTPTYNRGNLLNNVYVSLSNQTCLEFEWLILDDGSTDDTEKIVKSFSTQKFNIRYQKQKNGGKHRAINNAVKIAYGQYFLILDSDDSLVSDAVEKIKKFCNQIECLDEYEKFAGIAGERISKSGKLLCGEGSNKFYIDATNLQRKKYHLGGDMAEVYKTDLLKKYPFKEFERENFLTENTVWDRIAEDGYKVRWFKEPFYICDYLDDGLTKNLLNNKLKSFEGFTYSTIEAIRLGDLIRKIHSIYEFYIVGKTMKKLTWKELSKKIHVNILFIWISIFFSKLYLWAKEK